MGTSKTHGGPRDKTPLLPAFALGGDSAAPAPGVGEGGPEAAGGPAGGGSDGGAAPDPGAQAPAVTPAGSAPTPVPISPPAPPVTSVRGPWTSARRAMSSVVSGGGGGGRMGRAARRYVQAKGGSRRAAAAATGGRTATGRLGGFFADAARRGFTEAVRSLGIEVVGRSVEAVLATILNALAPAGTTDDDATARKSDQ